jgi:uncharacterized membrane protein YtjA (UPF0391 family)
MLMWAIIFLVVAIVASMFGFRQVSSAATQIAKVLFFIFVILFLISLIMHYVYVPAPAPIIYVPTTTAP